ncbi:hypothetical protein BDV34DRAFT_190363 [Aspergillus parasiticus]|uniref:Uncharacterized protein n=1 Tax=Aspergillus parasiticus TaxID=5067 RepID=A0A5N6DTH2_ASPPA|nr:hypothetical protein BDV34DRAFT_190363 [Aspergillus parasiticus]
MCTHSDAQNEHDLIPGGYNVYIVTAPIAGIDLESGVIDSTFWDTSALIRDLDRQFPRLHIRKNLFNPHSEHLLISVMRSAIRSARVKHVWVVLNTIAWPDLR